ncbi:DUF3891 family protein [Paenibacillus silvae]|uniref:DUF3891 family protein n=1 Tax=Paenibacillus silvae TaxID=1325358 RepID=UPI00119F6B29|nr:MULTISPECIES: DUF3891 family protein [Paenibacillus]MCK6074530.1 DUF3891 family protein [Paenibacillus silvae]MCK6147994.1 DUF3891 family protein [Paenibacillus silvae]MCK6266292.1 DUF3891 family protein [Paenibacillus silvae]
MIVYEREHDFVLTAQHEHGVAAGDMAAHWKTAWLPPGSHRDELILAAKEHDRGWIELDAAPLWNDYSQVPYSFRDFPLRPRFVFYRKGIEEVRQHNAYAGLLCSLMYTELFQKTLGANPQDDEDIRQYLLEEQQQQDKWKRELGGDAAALEQRLKNDVETMLFCDQLSLFLCMEEPGTPASRYDFFADGLSCAFDHCISPTVKAEWISGEKVGLSFFPFNEEFEVTMSYKAVPKASIRKFGMLQAYRRADWKKRRVVITALT